MTVPVPAGAGGVDDKGRIAIRPVTSTGGVDPGMYGSAANKASDLLYEVGSWLHDVACGDVEFDAMHDALDGRLMPTADAALNEARSRAAALAAAEQRADELYRELNPRWGDGDLVVVVTPDADGVSTWTGRIVDERMGAGGPKPHRIAGARVIVIEPAALSSRPVQPEGKQR